jgi:hypothetical protein
MMLKNAWSFRIRMQNKLCDISCIYQHIGQYTYCEQYSKPVAGSQFLGGGGGTAERM